MKKETINQLYKAFEQYALEVNGVECWSARELQELLGYSKWENFTNVINKAKEACKNVGQNVSDHFPDVRKKVSLGSGSERDVDDFLLTRYACYLVAQNGDPRKEQISGVLYERGINDKTFAVIRSKGDQALFRLSTATLKRKMNIPASRPLADFLPTISIKAKDFAAELTSVNVQAKDLQNETMITQEHIDNNAAVRRILLERGVIPEDLPAEEDVKKVERRLASEKKKAIENKRK